jgi:hypothetical protein
MLNEYCSFHIFSIEVESKLKSTFAMITIEKMELSGLIVVVLISFLNSGK